MRAVLYLVLIVLVLALIGWVTFNKDRDRPGINLETQKMKEDTKKVMEAGSELLKDAERSIDGASKQTEQPTAVPDK